jgi:hypothetical protein
MHKCIRLALPVLALVAGGCATNPDTLIGPAPERPWTVPETARYSAAAALSGRPAPVSDDIDPSGLLRLRTTDAESRNSIFAATASLAFSTGDLAPPGNTALPGIATSPRDTDSERPVKR